MTDLNVSLILKLVDKATAPARAVMRAVERMGGEGMMRQAAMVQRGSNMMASGLGTITGAATRGIGMLTDYRTLLAGFGLAAVGRDFVNTAAQFERFNVQLANLEGGSAGAERAMAWIENFAVKTPLEMEQVVASYAKLKAFGIDPTNGSMLALVDTMAATGGNVETMEGMVLALGQAWTKGKLQGEEAMQLLERGVPVWDILSKKLGKTTAEVMKMSEKGQLGRKEIQLLMDALGEANAGAAEDMSKTWDGMISNLWDYWSKFQRQVMGSGLFNWLKAKLKGTLDMFERMAANGDLQRWAENVGTAVQNGLAALWDFGAKLVEVWQAVSPWINRAADAVGGFGNAALILIGLNFASTILGIAAGFARLGLGAFMVASTALPLVVGALNAIGAAAVFLSTSALRMLLGALGWLGATATTLATGALTLLSGALALVGRAAVSLAMMVTAHPLIAMAVAVAAAAALIYQNWDSVVAAFRKVFAAAERLFTYLTGWTFSDVTAALKAAFDIDFYAIGVGMITSLWEGMKSVMAGLVDWAKAQLASITPDFSGMFSGGSTDGESGDIGMNGYTEADGQRATGGPVRAGGIYRWNEQGREMFSPTTDGTVINARQVKAMAGGGSRSMSMNLGGITINTAPGMSPQAIAREVRREMERLARSNGFGLHDGGGYV